MLPVGTLEWQLHFCHMNLSGVGFLPFSALWQSRSPCHGGSRKGKDNTAPGSGPSISFPTVPLRRPRSLSHGGDAMARFGSSAAQSGGSGASRMVERLVPESSSRIHLEGFPIGEETGLPLIPCPDCGLARVIERRSGKETTKNYLRVFFKCPRNGFPKLCGFYKFQREYLEELKKAGIVSMRMSSALEVADEVGEGADASSGNGDKKVEAKKDAANDTKLHTKMDDLLWKFNLLMFVFAVFIGAVMMYLAVGAK